MKLTSQELIKHTRNAFEFYQIELSAPAAAFWIIHPRDYHFLKSEFKEKTVQAKDMPELLGVTAIVAHIWRKPPIIAMNIEDLDFTDEPEEPDNDH